MNTNRILWSVSIAFDAYFRCLCSVNALILVKYISLEGAISNQFGYYSLGLDSVHGQCDDIAIIWIFWNLITFQRSNAQWWNELFSVYVCVPQTFTVQLKSFQTNLISFIPNYNHHILFCCWYEHFIGGNMSSCIEEPFRYRSDLSFFRSTGK